MAFKIGVCGAPFSNQAHPPGHPERSRGDPVAKAL